VSLCYYAESRHIVYLYVQDPYAELCQLNVIILSVVMLSPRIVSFDMLSIVMLIAIMLSVLVTEYKYSKSCLSKCH
jgi:hypothetical protein